MFGNDGRLVFFEHDHSYWLDKRQIPSVTQLLEKHKISSDLSDAPVAKVRIAGEHGTLVHEEIENFIRTGERGISDEFQDFLKLVYPLAERWECEVMVYTDDYAGRVDLIGYRDGKIAVIVDTKTGTLNVNSTAWQVSMYANAIPDSDGAVLYAFDAKMEGNSRLVPLIPVSRDCINALIEADKKDEIYNPMLPVVSANEKMLEIERQIVELETQLATLKEQDDRFKALLKQAMENGRVVKYDSEALSITYVAPYTQTKLDTTAVKKKYPKVYAECVKTSNVGASIRLKVKGA